MGSQELPRHDVAEKITQLSCTRSYKSCTCPACGEPKPKFQFLCKRQWQELSPHAQHSLLVHARNGKLTEGADRAMLWAFRVQGYTVWHEPPDAGGADGYLPPRMMKQAHNRKGDSDGT